MRLPSIRPEYWFSGIFIILCNIALFSDGIYDPGDGVMHHLIARHAFEHPELFLHHWGKPFYTLLSAPFAQAGYAGTVIFNVCCLTLGGWLTYRVAAKLNLPFPLLAGVFAITAPIALPVGISGLTEPLFALLLISGVYFVLNGRHGIAAMLISFLPFARTEGFFLAALFAVFFLLRRDYISILLLAAGTTLYTIIGGIYYHDLLWILHQNPYKGAEAIYGSGSLFHFVSLNEFIFGWALTALLIVGLIVFFIRSAISGKDAQAVLWLVYGTFMLFFVMHSVFWWKGLFGSLGLHRVMAGIMPVAVIIGWYGLQFLFRYQRNVQARYILSGALLVLHVFVTLRQHPLPVHPDTEERVLREAAAKIREQQLGARKMYCSYPLMALLTDKDPFDKNAWDIAERLTFPEPIGKGELFICETHFAVREIGLQPQSLIRSGLYNLRLTAGDTSDVKHFGVWVLEKK